MHQSFAIVNRPMIKCTVVNNASAFYHRGCFFGSYQLQSAIFLLLIVLIVALSSRSVPATRPLTVQINGSVVNAPAAMDIAEGQVMVPLRWAAEIIVTLKSNRESGQTG